MRCFKIRGSFLLALAIGAVVFGHPAFLTPDQDLSEYEKRLAAISEQIAAIRKKIQEEERRKTSVLSRLNRIGLKKTLLRKEMALNSTQLQKAEQEIAALKKKIPELRRALENEKKNVERILVTLYKFGKLSAFDVLLQVEEVGHLISESKNLTLLAQYQDHIISGYLSALDELHQAERKWESKKQESLDLIRKAEEKRQEYAGEEAKYKALIRNIERNRTVHIKTLEELKDRAEQLQNLIKKLEREEISLPFTLIPLYEKKGQLPWPVSGRVVTRFGPSRHPRFNTVTQNNGIEIRPRKGAVVKAVHAGRVAFADYFQGYGYLLIVDHGLTYFTLYGHLSPDFLVQKGDVVEPGQPIGHVGDFGSLKEETLYFEIRYKTQPLDPLQWLERR
ncbi:MAG: murein hydrolase activator EnvC family protein [Candidatus Aminicenantales bacterium]